MTRIDFTPLFRSTIGFDRMTRLLESAAQVDDAALGYPPYNIEKAGEDAYRISVAVAGFGTDDLEIEVHEGTLTVTGRKGEETGNGAYLHRGIAGRSFKRSFQLADHVKVVDAHLKDGLLHVDLVREIPEEMKPRRIEISTSAPKSIVSKAKKLVENKSKAA